MMKTLILTITVCFLIGCSNAAKPIAQSSNASAVTATPEKAQTAIAHSAENNEPGPYTRPGGESSSKWTASGDPIDTKEFDAAIMSAEKALSGKAGDATAKKSLGDAFYKRGMALTEARQYASAIGDYRRALKHDPANADAKEWIEKITMIYDSMKKSAPKEGEEPPPLPFKKA